MWVSNSEERGKGRSGQRGVSEDRSGSHLIEREDELTRRGPEVRNVSINEDLDR